MARAMVKLNGFQSTRDCRLFSGRRCAGRICRPALAKGAAWSEGTGQSGAVGKPGRSASLLKPPIPNAPPPPIAQFCQVGNELSTRSPLARSLASAKLTGGLKRQRDVPHRAATSSLPALKRKQRRFEVWQRIICWTAQVL